MVVTRSWLKESLFVILVAVAAFSIAFWAYAWERERGTMPSFYQSYYEPAIRVACGQSFGVDPTGQISEEMRRFLRTEQQTLSCESVSPAASLEKNPPTRAWYHLFVTVAQVWKITGISWPALDGFAAALLAITAVMVFALFRLFMGMPTAAVLAMVSILPALRFLPYLRDLNKAPFILAALLVAAWLVFRTPSRSRLFGVMAAIGVWLGIGYGFRPDVLIVLPLLVVTIFFFRPVSLKNGWLDGVIASLVLFGAFLLAASPIFSAFNANVGTCRWHFGLLGLSETHAGILGVTPASYSWLVHYDDNLVWRTVESYAERVLSLSDVGYCTPLYDQASQALYFETARTFPGDFMTRGLAAAQQVIGSGFWGIPWANVAPGWDAFFANHRGFFQNIWIVCWAMTVLVALAWNLRVGLFSIFALAYLSSYPVIQFDLRHYFHLAFLSWLPVGVAMGWMIHALILARQHRNLAAWKISVRWPALAAWGRAMLVMMAVFAIGYAVYLWGRHDQTLNVQRLFERYLRATGDEVAVASKITQGDLVTWTIHAPARSGASRIDGRMLRLDVGGPDCTSGLKTMSVALRGPEPGYRFRKDLTFDFGPSRSAATVFIPVYFEQPRLTTLSFEFPQQSMGCIERATWLRTDELPSLWVLTTLYPDWRESRLYQLK